MVVAAGGLLAHAPVPPPAVAFVLTGVILLVLWTSSTVRDGVRRLGSGPLVAFHLTRLFAGGYFLVLYKRAMLPGEFAIPAGWGDILVGAGAIVVLWTCVPMTTPARRQGLLVWNALGFADILVVLANGIRLFLNDPGLADPFTRFPLALLPTFVVPIVISSHLLLFAWHPRPSTSGRTASI